MFHNNIDSLASLTVTLSWTFFHFLVAAQWMDSSDYIDTYSLMFIVLKPLVRHRMLDWTGEPAMPKSYYQIMVMVWMQMLTQRMAAYSLV